ncbi:MAG TPA: hypothetical protein VMW49_00520, partial [Candidatus Dormibacteraeota bacterium]|nr:hypothetical protein [Candidatus Dormibacteraeota bacterium]
MVDSPRVLVVAGQAPDVAQLASDLRSQGLSPGTVPTVDAAARAIETTDIDAVLFADPDAEPGLVPFLKRFRSSDGHGETPVVLLVRNHEAPETLAAMAAGATDALAASSSTTSIAQAVLRHINTARDHVEGAREQELWVVCGPRGGVGRTLLATNLAVIVGEKSRAALVDNVPRFGSILLAYNLPPQTPTWVELHGEAGSVDLVDRLPRHPSGVTVLPAPSRPELADSVSPTDVNTLIRNLVQACDVVVVDQGGRLDNGGIDLLETATHVIVTGTPDNAGVYAVQSWLRVCDKLGIHRDRIHVLLNAVLPYHQADRDRAARVLEHPVFLVPHAGIDGVRSMSAGEPLAWRQPNHRF